MKLRFSAPILAIALFCIRAFAAAGGEYTGQFDKVLVPNTEDFEKLVFKGSSSGQFATLGKLSDEAHFALGRLSNPQTGQYTITALLIEDGDEDPVFFADINQDLKFTPDEKVPMNPALKDNPYLWSANVMVGVKDGFFTTCPIYVRYFKSIQSANMGPEDRLITQSTEVLARGTVNVNGRKVLVQYALPAGEKKVNPQSGWLGMDIDGDGEIDMDNLSPEAAKADEESVIFRVGSTYLSTKKADLSKNQIVLREHEAKEYKRVELGVGKDFPDFNFADFEGRKRKFGEFRGKYVLMDIWGLWCPACRDELPYIREANRRFKARNLEVVGLNTDTDFTFESITKALRENNMTWTQARLDSIIDLLRKELRINSFPTTFLISPEGKILSMSRSERDEPDLRGKDLLDTLNEILPK